ncbi:MAG: replicative DNA helicase [Nocardioidaceae bacterium]
MAAEQSVLGSMLISKDAIADVGEVLRGVDFYRPSHEIIHDAIIDLYGRGEPADPVTVAAELGRRGELERVGGAPYLHTLSANVPIAQNAGYYAEIVREKAILRRLVEAGTKIVQIGYAGEGQVDDVVDQAQAEVYKVTDRRTSEDYAPLSDIMDGVLDEIEAIGNREAGLYGVPTGFADLDDLTNGLHAGQMIIVAARPAMGKALALDTPLPTPSGWTTMGEVRVGDELYDAQGRPTRVVAATEVMVDRPCFELTFSDGSVIVADAEHQWVTAPLHAATPVPAPELAATPLYWQTQRDLDARRPTTSGARPGRRSSGGAVLELELLTTRELAATVGRVHTIPMPDGGVVKVESVRPVPSVPVRCVQVDNPMALYLAGPSGIPTHNSTLALDLCRAASIHNNLASVFFSLEMTRSEITMRLLSAEAKVPLNHIRNGQMSDDDWTKMARKMGEVSSAPMFIDDSPNMTMMEIRSKARRLKQRHDLRLVVIDYMQLMTSGKKVESRQLEVSEFSRQIKLLAKELEVPIIALSQLNRGPEQRSDKRPMLSDLRESGCVTRDTRLLRADTNAEVTIGQLLDSGATDVPVWAFDDRLKLVPRTLTHAFPSGTKEVFEVTLASGRRVQATANHPLLTYDGWMPLGELRVGSRIGALRHVPPPIEVVPHTDEDIHDAALAVRDLGADGIPTWVPALPKVLLASFLQQLWAVAGVVTWDADRERGRIAYSASSRQLADDVAALLLRFNVFSQVRRVRTPGFRTSWRVEVARAEDQLRFVDRVGVPAAHEQAARGLAAHVAASRKAVVDSVPEQVVTRVRDVLDTGRASREPATIGSVLAETTLDELVDSVRPHTERMAQIAAVLDDADLDVVATNDVLWDTITSIEARGEQEVFDATVLGLHNFVANGIALHNSLEQDADMVILLHRDDVYEKESTRPGEADLIIAKHRNGPTRDITVAFQGHYSRFVDMAH